MESNSGGWSPDCYYCEVSLKFILFCLEMGMAFHMGPRPGRHGPRDQSSTLGRTRSLMVLVSGLNQFLRRQ